MEQGGRLPECVLELDDVEVAMVTTGGGDGRREEMVELKSCSWLSACQEDRGKK